TYPGDFNNGTAMIPVTPYMVGGNMPSTIAFVEYFIDGNDGYGTIYGANVAGYTWVLHTTNLSVSPATAPLPTDTVGFYDPTGTNDIGYIAELTGIEAGSIVQVTLVNTYTPDAAPAITIDKNIGGSVGWGDIFNTQFVVQRYADAAGTTPVGAPTIVPLSAFTQTGAGSGEFVLPGTLPAGFYSITELGAEVAFIAGDTTEHVQNLVSSSFVLTVGNPNAGTPDEVRNPNAANIYWLGSGDVATFTFTNTYAQNAALIVNKVIDAVDANGAAMSPSAVAPMAMVFNITNANNALVAQFTYDMFINNQYILTGLPAGTYTITESGGAASGFSGPVVSVTSGGTTTAGNSATFTIGDGLPDVTLTFTNTYTQISNVFDLQVQKLFSGISLAAIPADFELVITGSGGFTQNISLLNAIFGTTLLNLPLGTYTISEANADVAGYTRTVSVYDVTGTVVSQVLPYSFTASQGGAQLSFAIFNEYAIIPPVTGSLVIEKDFVGLSVATTSPSAISFVVQGTDAAGNEVYRNTVMYSDFVGGSYTLTNLPVGNYTIVENGGLVAGYLLTVLPSATQTVPVYPGETTIVAFTNSYTALPPTDLPSLTIQKVFHGLLPDEQPQTMTITITNPQGAEDSYDFAQILAGIVLEAIALGDYIIDELNADVEGFNMTTTVEVQGLNIAQPTGLPATIPIASATDDVLVIINNFYTPETFALRLQKTFAGLTASQIPANFALVLTNTDGFRQTIGLADAMAGITIPGLTVGMYTVAEINAAVSGFTFTANPAMPHTFTVDEGGQLITLNITNTYTASGTQPPVTPPAPPAPPPRPPGTPLAPPTTTPYIPWEPRGPGQTGDEGADEATDATDETPTDDEPTDAYIIIAIHVPTHIHHAYMVGYAEDGTIRPHANITRAEVTTIFFRLISDHQRANIWSQTNSFDDVPLARWFNNPISTMENGGLFAGMPLAAEPNFYPNQAATRAEFAAMVVNFIGLGHYQNVQADAFTDTAGHWAEDAINTAFLQGWIRGYGDGTFRPDQLITRAEVAALVNRAMGRLPQTVDDLLPGMVTWPDNMDQSRWYYLYIQEATNTHYYYRKADGVHETWARLLPPRDWRRLERPYSTPWDLYPY
ncbi:MAG: S-layer homology domain-containing protein, partial [Defluviitaleaceae bacterium]|nr:S-layer homology domain-containing protein [Defluviitaleaceae bacterium]